MSIHLRIGLGGRIITVPDAPPEIFLDDIVFSLTKVRSMEEDMIELQEMQELNEVPDEHRDPMWAAVLSFLRFKLDMHNNGHGLPQMKPGDFVEVFHDHQSVITHWLVDFGSADSDCVWASLPNYEYRPRDVTPASAR